MRVALRLLTALAVAGAIASPTIATGCYHQSYHGAWGDNERPYYARWEAETHRDHKEWSERGASEQQEYWSWRQNHQQ